LVSRIPRYNRKTEKRLAPVIVNRATGDATAVMFRELKKNIFILFCWFFYLAVDKTHIIK